MVDGAAYPRRGAMCLGYAQFENRRTTAMNIDNTKRKIAYTLAEFAALFGMERTWAYRLLYAGKIMV